MACSGAPGEPTATDSGATTTTSTTAGGESQGTTTSVDPTMDAPTTTTSGATTTAGTTLDTTSTTEGLGECAPGDSRSCYSGPDGTDGVGACQGGEQECGPDETWGPCVGEVVPAPETCDEPGDEDCDGEDPCLGDGAFAWGLTFGQGGDDQGRRVAFDGAGNVVVAAWGNGPIDFGGGVLENGGRDVFLAKFSPTGDLLWNKRFGDADDQGGPEYGFAVTPAGDVVLAGHFHGAIDFGGGPLVNPSPVADIFLVKLDGDGEHVWSKSFNAGEHTAVQDLAIADNGDILLTGGFYGFLDLDDVGLSGNGDADIYVARFTAAGAHVWSRGIGDSVAQHGLGIAVDAAGNSYVTGLFRGTIDPGGGPLISVGSEDIFLFKLDPAGATVWAKRFGDVGGQGANAVAVDSKGRVSITGAVNGGVDFGGGLFKEPAVFSYLAQFDTDGAHLWSRKLCVLGYSLGQDVVVDGLDNVLVTGEYADQCELGGAPLVAIDLGDVFVGKFSPKGEHGWSRGLGGADNQFSAAIAGSATGTVAVTGDFLGAIDLGGGAKASKGGRDGFVVVIDP
ncbi:hypothetical protein OV203_47880 [Nannocystis sp. ILAH1]|uniref:hypothetical protein n=1 Tax=Nannocystis sp. ILAH1 TaxID=2996789 RepID=UPI00226DD29B|nr:hypothetical protein [Nannocystis sp. ILAH1]MCY0994941.1 hypothetical protein [Nannocystis sp. ILAH1]